MLAGSLPASQILAHRLIAAGYAGMRVRSFAPGAGDSDLNLVMWKWGEGRPARVVLIDDEGRLSGNPGPLERRAVFLSAGSVASDGATMRLPSIASQPSSWPVSTAPTTRQPFRQAPPSTATDARR